MIDTQNPFVFWLMVSFLVVLLYFVVLIVDSIIAKSTRHANKIWSDRDDFWKRHIADEFPKSYADSCFICNSTTCEGCKFDKRGGI